MATLQDQAFVAGLAARFADFVLPAWRSHETIAQGTERQLRAAVERGNDERSAVFIAVIDGERAGFAWVLMIEDFYTGEPVGKVSEIAAVRGGVGVGRTLMERCELWAQAHGAQLMMLNALEGNLGAREFYRRRGYEAEYTTLAKRLSAGTV